MTRTPPNSHTSPHLAPDPGELAAALPAGLDLAGVTVRNVYFEEGEAGGGGQVAA